MDHEIGMDISRSSGSTVGQPCVDPTEPRPDPYLDGDFDLRSQGNLRGTDLEFLLNRMKCSKCFKLTSYPSQKRIRIKSSK